MRSVLAGVTFIAAEAAVTVEPGKHGLGMRAGGRSAHRPANALYGP